MISGDFTMRQLAHNGHIDALDQGVTQKSLWACIEPETSF